MASPSIRPRMLVADDQGNIYDHPDFLLHVPPRGRVEPAPSRRTHALARRERAFVARTPRRGAQPRNRETEVMEDWAVAAFAAPAHTLTAHPVYVTDEGAPMLPLFAYGAVGFANGRFYVCAKKVDEDVRQVFKGISRGRSNAPPRRSWRRSRTTALCSISCRTAPCAMPAPPPKICVWAAMKPPCPRPAPATPAASAAFRNRKRTPKSVPRRSVVSPLRRPPRKWWK